MTGSGGSVGGLVGSGSGSVSGSYATGAVTGSGGSVGGLVGSGSRSVTVRDSYATGAVTGSGGSVGGLVGSGSRFTVRDSYATGAVTGSGGNVGGLVGSGSSSPSGTATPRALCRGGDTADRRRRPGRLRLPDPPIGYVTIRDSYATGTVSGGDSGDRSLVGSGRLHQWGYATGAVTGTFRVGGLIGRGGIHLVQLCRRESFGQRCTVGGLIGDNTGTVTDSYWDTVTSGQSHSDGGQGKTTSELQSAHRILRYLRQLERGPGQHGQAIGTPWPAGTIRGTLARQASIRC